MKFRIMCTVTTDAPDEKSALLKIRSASNFEEHFGLKIEPVDFSSLKKKDGNDGRKDTKSEDPMPKLRTEIRRVPG